MNWLKKKVIQWVREDWDAEYKKNVADTTMIFSLINGYLCGRISEADFLNDIKVITRVK
jgi:hypothetical protein